MYHFYVLLLLQLLMLHHDSYFVLISHHVQLRLILSFKICSASFLLLLFSRCAINIILSKGCCFMYTHMHAHTHARMHTHAHTHIYTQTHNIRIYIYIICHPNLGYMTTKLYGTFMWMRSCRTSCFHVSYRRRICWTR